MSTILVTGSSGLIGHALSTQLSGTHQVICLDQRPSALSSPCVKAQIQSPEDLQQLDRYDIEVAVHLAGVTGTCTERDAFMVNVEGTRCLTQYLLERGCRKFVMASSVAVVGFQNVKFRPAQLPFSDEAPCLDRDGYGFSKYLMEQIAHYYSRQRDDADMIILRLASTFPDDALPCLAAVQPLRSWAMATITVMALSDTTRAFALAAEAPRRPGVRMMNATPPLAWVKDPVAMIMRAWYGSAVDVSYFEQPGHEWDSLYDVRRIKAELGFVARVLPNNIQSLT